MRFPSIGRFVRDDKGQLIMSFGLTMPIVMCAAGIAVDTSMWYKQREQLQNVADTAALSAARELTGSGSLELLKANAVKAGQSAIDAHVPGRTRSVTVDTTTMTVSVDIADVGISSFAQLFGIDKVDLAVTGGASMGTRYSRSCVLALDPDAKTGINLTGSARFIAKDCVLWSNATSPQSIVVGGTATVQVARMCSVGNTVFNGSSNSFTGQWQANCKPLKDPLATWVGPSAARPCIKNFNVSSNADVTLSPGTYCGGLSASSKGKITLQKGVYVIDGGPLKLTADASIEGQEVGIYLTGKGADATISGQSNVRLTAAASGDMDGVVLASDPAQTGTLAVRITGGATVDLVGTVHLPKQDFVWRGNSRSLDPSRVTQIIAKTVDIAGTTDIVYEAAFESQGYEVIQHAQAMVYLTR